MLVGIIIFINSAALIWFWVRNMRVKQVLQWWFQRQASILENQCETVQNGLMQDLFAMRRSAELASMESGSTTVEPDKLRCLELIYNSLEEISDTLFPAYARESLPLAIQSKLNQWRNFHPALNIELDMPRYWHNEISSHQSQLIIYMLDELLRIINLSANLPIHLKIILSERPTLKILSVEFTYSRLDYLKNRRGFNDLHYLQQVFSVLSGGKCLYWSKNKMFFVQFYWKYI
jgi:hypothetical protein